MIIAITIVIFIIIIIIITARRPHEARRPCAKVQKALPSLPREPKGLSSRQGTNPLDGKLVLQAGKLIHSVYPSRKRATDGGGCTPIAPKLGAAAAAGGVIQPQLAETLPTAAGVVDPPAAATGCGIQSKAKKHYIQFLQQEGVYPSRANKACSNRCRGALADHSMGKL